MSTHKRIRQGCFSATHCMAFAAAAFLATTCQAQFDTIINVPPDTAPASIRSNTQLNLGNGGTLPPSFHAGLTNGSGRNIEVNIAGGIVGDRFQANSGSRVTISGGSIGGNLHVLRESKVVLAGGSIGDFLFAQPGSMITISGGEFRLDGVPVEGLNVVGDTLPIDIATGLLSGVFQDGTPFAFTNQDFQFTSEEFIPAGVLTLEYSEVADVSGPMHIIASQDNIPLGIREGQSLHVGLGGTVGDNFSAGWGSELLVAEGGIVGQNLEAVGADVTILGGEVGPHFDAFAGSRVSISGGFVDNDFQIHAGSQVIISGGTVGSNDPGSQAVEALKDSILIITGGSVGSSRNGIVVFSGSQLTIAGGEMAGRLFVEEGRNRSSSPHAAGGRLCRQRPGYRLE